MSKTMKRNNMIIEVSDAVYALISQEEINTALQQHLSCNWGEVDDTLWAYNDEAYKAGNATLSWHTSTEGLGFTIEHNPEAVSVTVYLSNVFQIENIDVA